MNTLRLQNSFSRDGRNLARTLKTYFKKLYYKCHINAVIKKMAAEINKT